jgi:L-threonylcarbamoyladenylate synthase
MIIIDYKKQHHKKIIDACVSALKSGKAVAYPTDTSYGLAVDATNIGAIKKLYQIKGRDFNKPVHIVVPSAAYAKKIARWNKAASRLAKKFWPGPLTLVLPVGDGLKPSPTLRQLSANTGSIGLRMPKNQIALDLAKNLRRPITATSANVSGGADCYSADEIIKQFSAKGGSAFGGKNQQFKPDIIINSGKLPISKPSTLVRVFDDVVKVLREGPVTQKQIISLLNTK